MTKIMSVFIGILFLTGFYDPGINYIELNNITIELGEKIPLDNIKNNLLNNNFIFEDNVPKDFGGHTTKTGIFNYYVVQRDEERMYSKLTKNSATISVVDTVKPEIRVKNKKFNYGSNIKVTDIANCYDLSNCQITFKNDINTRKEGKQSVTIIASDESDNISEITVLITIKNKPNYYSSSNSVMDEYNKSLNSNLSEEDKINLRNQIVMYAKQFEGNPYVYGGTSLTNGIDCSAFTRAIYANFGYKLPRNVKAQFYIGKTVSVNQLLPGDLVLYHNEDGSVYHVTMYIGNNMLIHAGTPQTGIQITKMWSDPRYYKRIIY